MTADSSDSDEGGPRLSGLTIGALTLTPEFAPDVTEYAVTTTNSSNKVTAATDDESATITIKLGETEIQNESSPSWQVGENTLTITVANNDGESVYTVTVTKAS